MTKSEKSDVVVNNPHDATFKKVMKDKAVAKDIIQHNLPEEMIRDIDLDTLELLDGSFVSETLSERFSDVLYGVKVSGHDVYITFLFEHKSYTDQLAIFQVGRYMMDLWERIFKERGEVPIVFPIIFYHGQQKWKYATDIREYIKHYDELPAYMTERLPTLKHDFITMESHDDERMYVYDPQTRLFLRTFKLIFSDVQQLVVALLTSVDEMQGVVPDEVIYRSVELILFYYSQANKDVTEEFILEQIRKLDGKGAEIVTILEARERKGMEAGLLKGRQEGIEAGLLRGRQEGRQEGIEAAKLELAQNMLKDGLSVERVAKYAELTVEQVEALKKKLN